jgi:hypothetical protein
VRARRDKAGRRYLAPAAVFAVLVAGGPAAVELARDAEAVSEVPACSGAESVDLDCYRRRYRVLTARAGPRAAIHDLVRRARRLPYLRAACHRLMHGIGRSAGRRSGLRAFAEGDDSCSSGFYHGVVEAVMAARGLAAVKRDPASVCAPFRRHGHHRLAHYNCVHGMGHGFMALLRSNVFRSLDACDALAEGWERSHCFGGVFMENLTALSNPRRPSRNLDPERPLYPCTAVAARFKHECYMKQTAYALLVRNDDFRAVFRLCERSPDVRFRDDCYDGLGGDAAIMSSKYVTGAARKRATTRAVCRMGPTTTARRHCVVGAMTVTVRDGASQTSDPVAFCSGFRERYLHAACSRAHLDIVQKLTGRRRSTWKDESDTPRLLCRHAAALEAEGLGATPDDREQIR